MAATVTEPSPVFYLDMNIWVSITRGCAQHDERCERLHAAIVSALDGGRMTIALSAANYLELWHRRDQRSREQVGGLMRDLTGYVTLESPYLVRKREVYNHIDRFRGVTSDRVTLADLIGRGAAHAFGSPYGRFRFVESLASADGTLPEGPAVPPPVKWDGLVSGSAWEWLQLVGTPELIESPGVDRTPEHRYGDNQMRTELALRKRLSEDPDVYDRLRDLMVAQEVDDLLEEINNYCEHVDINPLGLFFSEADTLSPPDAMRSFVEDLPSAYTWARLRYWKHRDLSHPWEQHDWTDISSLSVAVPYCDVIITERRWAHVIKAAGLANRFDTQVGHGLAEFESFLPR